MLKMSLNLRDFFLASNPAKTINLGNPDDSKYYIDFASVRGGKIIEQLKRTITRLSPDEPTCQLFTGHIGTGKSTELLRLKEELQKEDFHVVYFESSKDLDMADVDITDILLSVARQVSDSLEQININLLTARFNALLQGLDDVLKIHLNGDFMELGVSNNCDNSQVFSLSYAIGKITGKAKDAPNLRSQIRQYLEPRTNLILEAINKELLAPGIKELKQRHQAGLVVIVDNLDRVDISLKPTGRKQPEYLFVDRGEQLKRINCHVVYTIPLVLIFSNNLGQLTSRFGVDPKVLPMVPVRLRDGSDCLEGLDLLRKMVIRRAFPNLNGQDNSELVMEVFDTPETLDRLCRVSGGHVRNLLQLIYSCVQEEDPPLTRTILEKVIRQRRHQLTLAINSEEWELLQQVAKFKTVNHVSGEMKYQMLLRSLWVFEYRYHDDYWFDINPILEND
jgi:hypothetical protein